MCLHQKKKKYLKVICLLHIDFFIAMKRARLVNWQQFFKSKKALESYPRTKQMKTKTLKKSVEYVS